MWNQNIKQNRTQAYRYRKQIGVCQRGGGWRVGEMGEEESKGWKKRDLPDDCKCSWVS